MELYGLDGSLYIPDPNFFGGDLEIVRSDGTAEPVPPWDHPFGRPNQERGGNVRANYRCAGLADMAAAIAEDRPHRCSLELATHVVEVMAGILLSGEAGQFVEMRTTCDRPAPLSPEAARALLREPS